ncbi:hypothetical protein OsI_21488 [Oryza sativa Indica Group]|uniref:GAGA-binding transcriptional activator n=1 Tax=Oryza sativa subsp. indica TaxID=39946 RepID=A2Y8V8_ORYSI|nr:hypothetical protein OsI_21488 [Oryza sativa Indica Group]
MDNLGHRENGRQRPDQYKGLHTQWMMPQTQRHLKDHQSMNLLALMNDRDNAIRERDHALAEKKAAIAERDMAFTQRDAAMAERNAAVVERDNALAALESIPYLNSSRSAGKAKRPKKNSSQASPLKRPSGVLRKTKKPSGDWKNVGMSGCGDDSAHASVMKNEWKDQNLGLNQVAFDDSTMPAPACSCTGKLRQCYKWGNGGWQSSCCTMNISMYPLPVMPNKRHARMGGRKMSGGAFTKLLSRLAAEGHDLSTPVDLKDHWAKHGTNRYITIR